MDTERNQFVELNNKQASEEPDRYIPFEVGERVLVKGYPFRIARVKVGMNELVLKPVGVRRVGSV